MLKFADVRNAVSLSMEVYSLGNHQCKNLDLVFKLDLQIVSATKMKGKSEFK